MVELPVRTNNLNNKQTNRIEMMTRRRSRINRALREREEYAKPGRLMRKMENVLMAWIQSNDYKRLLYTNPEAIKKKAVAIYQHYKPTKDDGLHKFQPSNTWFCHFKKRYLSKFSPESSDDDVEFVGEIYTIDDSSNDMSSENETPSINVEEVYQINEVVEDVKANIIEIADTEIVFDDVDLSGMRQYPTFKECNLFGEYVAKHLQQLPLEISLKLQSGVQTLVMQTRLEYIRGYPSKAHMMVRQEVPEAGMIQSEATSIKTPTKEKLGVPPEVRTIKKSQNSDQHEAKRFKSEQETKPSTQSTRTDCIVFAENIASQLEQLAEEVRLQLQSDIYALIMQACSKLADAEAFNRVKLKSKNSEVLEV